MIHLAATEMKLKTKAFMRLVTLSPKALVSSLLMMVLLKLCINAISRRKTVFSAMNDLGSLFQPNVSLSERRGQTCLDYAERKKRR